jgi:hypothetical protein
VLGPIFFIYINDLPCKLLSNPHSNCILFAQDVSVVLNRKSFQEVIALSESIIDEMDWWCTRSNLILNHSETHSMIFSAGHYQLDIGLMTNNCNAVNHCKFLGLHFDRHLNWDLHISHSVKKFSLLSSFCY